MISEGKERRDVQIALIIMFVALGWRLAQFLTLSAQALNWPYELDYAEGIVWQQADLMFTHDAYGPIEGFPSIVFHYTPLYHVLVKGLASVTGLDTLFTGRAVSLLATLLSCGVVAHLIKHCLPPDMPRKAAALSAVGGALAMFCSYPLAYSALVVRVDMLAILLSLFGFWLGLKSYANPKLIALAALSFVAAVFTKQTAIAAPTALFCIMLVFRPKLAWVGIALCIAMGLTLLGVLNAVTDGGFFKHIFLYNVNRIDWSRLYFIGPIIAMHGALFGVIAMVVFGQLRRYKALGGRALFVTLANNPADLAQLNVFAYLITATLMLGALAKMGSSLNYFAEWFFVISIFMGIALSKASAAAFNRRNLQTMGDGGVLWVSLVPFALAFQAMITEMPKFPIALTPGALVSLDALSARVRAAKRPVISDEMVLVKRSGKRVVWEPMIFRELVSTGAWDERPFLNMIHAQQFDMFIMGNDHVTDYSPAVLAAVNEAYPRVEHRAGFTIRLPLNTTAQAYK